MSECENRVYAVCLLRAFLGVQSVCIGVCIYGFFLLLLLLSFFRYTTRTKHVVVGG